MSDGIKAGVPVKQSFVGAGKYKTPAAALGLEESKPTKAKPIYPTPAAALEKAGSKSQSPK